MRRRKALRAAVLIVLAGAAVAIWLSPVREQLSRNNVQQFVGLLRGLWYGPAAFILAFTLACLFAIPASVFVLAAGLIWGWQLGALYSIVGGLLGAIASFWAGRFVGEGLLLRFGRYGQLVSRHVDHAGFLSLLVLRFIPGIPFAVLNYGSGVAGVRFRDFIPATLIGITPPMFVFAYCADALFNGSMSEGEAVKRLMIVGALMVGLVLLPQVVKRMTRRAGVAAVEAADPAETP
jgi:uncharacterized membrane protein YdjX (TVP38/TMEM64 family)